MKYNPQNDYIMTAPMSRFNAYNKYDIMGIEADLENILQDIDCPVLKDRVEKRYKKVIEYITKKLEYKNAICR